jgi:acetylornithine deacetylase
VPHRAPALYPVKTMSSKPAAAIDPIALTRRLIDIDSTTFNEGAVGRELVEILTERGFLVETMPVEQDPESRSASDRFNVYAGAASKAPDVVLSTHMDTVPPYFASSEDDEFIYGRGACDAKGIIAAQIAAAERLRAEGFCVGLLFVVGEERDSAGAKVADRHSRGSRFLINGEPTDNRLALASKGTLRVKLTAKGKLAHSAYPELGESAIHKLLEALNNVMALPLPVTEDIGPSTLNVGLIEGGRAPNVVADHAEAQLLIRLVGPAEETRAAVVKAVGDLAEVDFTLEIPFQRLRAIDGLPTMVAAFTTDIPWLATWGEPLLLGPGSIHVAHTRDERLAKRELLEAVDLYVKVAKGLVKG